MRKNLGLREHDLHLTLGFDLKDIHGVSKNRTTVEFSNEQLWKHFVEKSFIHESKLAVNHTDLKDGALRLVRAKLKL